MERKRFLITVFLLVTGGIGIAALDSAVELSPVAALLVTLAVGVPIMVYATWPELTGKSQQ